MEKAWKSFSIGRVKSAFLFVFHHVPERKTIRDGENSLKLMWL
jgi:hypothetical protein